MVFSYQTCFFLIIIKNRKLSLKIVIKPLVTAFKNNFMLFTIKTKKARLTTTKHKIVFYSQKHKMICF